MKKNCLLLSTLLGATSLFATDYIYTGVGAYDTITPPQYDNVVLTLDENGTVNANKRARFVVGSNVLYSLKTDPKNNPSDFAAWDIIWGFNINVKSNAGGEKEVLNLTDKVSFVGYVDGSNYRIYNYTGSEYPTNTTALAKFNELTLINNAVFKFETNTRLVGNSLVVDNDNSGIWVNKGTLQYQVAKTEWQKSKAFLQVDSGATFKMETPSAFTIRKALIAGNFVNETANSIVFSSNLNYPSIITGNLFSVGRLKVSAGALEITGEANFVYNKSSNSSVLLERGGKIILNKENALNALVKSTQDAYNASANKADFVVREENGTNVYYKKTPPVIVLTGSLDNVVEVNATNAFALSFSGCAKGTVEIASDATWIVSDFGNYQSTPTVVLKNFENDAVFFTTTAMGNYEKMITDVNVITADGQEYGKDDLSFIADTFKGYNGYWMTVPALAVPEPAEWAMIFGGIALGLAIYRRRK